jgi:hypothetical protein
MIDVLGVAMGVDMQGFTRTPDSDELPPGFSAKPASSPASPPESPKPSSTPASTSAPPPAPAQAEKDVEMLEPEVAAAKRDAEAAKKTGSEAYKKKDFAVATESFQKAWELWPKDITYLTNLGGAFPGTALCSWPTRGKFF